MSTSLKNIYDITNVAYIPADSFTVVRQLAANTAETVTIPTNAKYVEITTTATLYITYSGVTATVPAGDTTDGTGADICLTTVRRSLHGITDISIISAGTPNVSLIFFRA